MLALTLTLGENILGTSTEVGAHPSHNHEIKTSSSEWPQEQSRLEKAVK